VTLGVFFAEGVEVAPKTPPGDGAVVAVMEVRGGERGGGGPLRR